MEENSNTAIKKIANKSNRKKFICIAAIFLVLMIFASIVIVRNNNFNINVSKGNEYYNDDKFDDAQKYYNKALEYKQDNNIKDKIDLCNSMKRSLSNFNDGNNFFQQKNYLSAYKVLNNVIKEDTKRYNTAQDKVKEALILYIQNAIQKPNALADDTTALDVLDKVNLLSSKFPNDEKVKSVMDLYKSKQQQEIDSQNKLAEEKQNEIETSKINSIKISKLYTSSPNSAGGVDLHVVWTNKANKVIKYITFEVVPYNAVGDAQYCQIKAISNYRAKVTGPINPGQTYGDNYLWECAWYNNTIKTAKLVQVDIEYMDGSTVTVDSSLISKIMN